MKKTAENLERQEGKLTPPYQGEGRKTQGRRKKLMIFLVILALLFVISSVITGILLGDRTDRPGGLPADSFVIGREDTDGDVLHLAGRITLPDGTPFTDGSLELHSAVRKTRTDREGWFLFEDVEIGLHSLFILDDQGKTLAEIKVELNRNGEAEYSPLRIEKTAASRYLFHLSDDIRYLELDLEMDQGALTIRMDKTAAVDREGNVSLPGQIFAGEKGPVILPSGTVVTGDHYIFHGTVMILPDNGVVHIPQGGLTLEDGTVVSENGELTLTDGTVISPDGIRYPDQTETLRPEYPVQLTKPKAETDRPLENPTVQAVQDKEPAENTRPAGGLQEPGTPKSENEKEESSTAAEETSRPPDKVESDNPSETLAPDYGDLGVYYEDHGVWNVWKDAREIRLFDYMPGQSSTASIADPVVKPGSSGYYPFEVTNTFSSHSVKIRVTVTEQTIHLPLRFRLVTVNGSNQKTAVSDWSSPLSGGSAGVVVANANASPPGSTVRYHLEWQWPYETGRDTVDTAVAGRDSERNRTYTVKVEINARR